MFRTEFFFAILFVFALSACEAGSSGEEDVTSASNDDFYTIDLKGNAQGSTYHIIFTSSDTLNYGGEVDFILKQMDTALSLWVDNSALSTFNRFDRDTLMLEDPQGYFEEVLRMSEKVYELSSGAFDPSVYPLVRTWGFGAQRADSMAVEKVDSLLQIVGFDQQSLTWNVDTESGRLTMIKSDPRTELDFNAIAQGYTVDKVCEMLASKGIENYLVEIGGEARCAGMHPSDRPWNLQIDQPIEGSNEHEMQALIGVENRAVATSGNYRKIREVNGRKYSHTINPKTGFPVEHSLLSATVVNESCALADAYATVFMVVGMEEAKSLLESQTFPNTEAYFIYADEQGELKTWSTERFKTWIVAEAEANAD